MTHFSRAKTSACTQREHGRIGTPQHIQRGSSLRYFSRHSRGVWTMECLSKKQNILVCPLPLMSKGESELVLLPSSPKEEIVGIMMHVLYLMENLSQKNNSLTYNQMNLQKRYQMQDSSKESDDSSKYDNLALPSSPKWDIVGIMRQVVSLMENHTDDRSQCSMSATRI